MRLLVLTTRFPEGDGKGDQLRLFSWLTYLGPRHDVTVLTSGRPSTPDATARATRLSSVHVVSPRASQRFRSACTSLARGKPGQVGLMMPDRTWRSAEALASTADVTLAMTVRAVRGPLSSPLVVDHVDALSLNMRRRAQGPEDFLRRGAAWVDSGLLSRWERQVARYAAAQVVTSQEDAAALPGPAPVHVVGNAPNFKRFEESTGHVRDVDVIFTGNMRYPPNRAAARALIDQILPLVRREIPALRAMIVGRGASILGQPRGVEVRSDVPSVVPYLQRARIAAVPLRIGTGVPNKVLEAVASGAAIVATPEIAERFESPLPTATNERDFAELILNLLRDESLRRAAVRTAAPIGETTPELIGLQLEAILLDAIER